MKVRQTFLLFLLGAGLLSASSVSAICDPAAGGSATNPYPPGPLSASCSGQYPVSNIYAGANSAVNVSFTPATGGEYNNLTIREQLTANFAEIDNFPNVQLFESTAITRFNYGETFSTAGPLRAGFVQFTYTLRSATYIYSGSSNLTASISPFAADNPLTSLTCSGQRADCVLYYYSRPPLYTYSLGQPFTLSAVGNMLVNADRYSYFGSGNLDVSYMFRFFEADGVTPALLTVATPEPATGLLIGLPLALALLKGWRKPRSRQ